MNNIEKKYHIVLIGGGHANAQILKFYAMEPYSDLQITLISDKAYAPYSGMLPGHLAGWYTHEDIHFDLYKLSQKAGVRFVNARVKGIDASLKIIKIDGRPDIHYDVCSINVGSTPRWTQNVATNSNIIPLKPIPNLLSRWQDFIQKITIQPKAYKVVIVGGGASGFEISLILAKKFKNLNLEITLIDKHSELLHSHNSNIQKAAKYELKKNKVKLILNCKVESFKENSLVIKNINSSPTKIENESNKEIHFDFCFLATQASAQSWFKESDLPVDEVGFLQVDSTLQVQGVKALFGAGDCIHFSNLNLAKAGVYPVRQAKYLYENIKNTLLEKPLKTYTPQKRFLSLLTMGEKRCLASYGPFSAMGEWVWRWKNHIDVNFMDKNARWQKFELMKASTPLVDNSNKEEMLCGGCGSKVGALSLKNILNKISDKNSIKIEDAAVMDIVPSSQLIASMDFFKSFVNDPYLLGFIGTQHALSDIFAMGTSAEYALANVVLEKKSNSLIEEDFHNIISGCLDSLKKENVKLVGGHTSYAQEMAFGLSVFSTRATAPLMLKSQLKVGESLILTKALGTGLILRANMFGECEGFHMHEAIESMKNSNAAAVPIMQKYQVRACTDVTGFGLLGHLLEMVEASNVEVQIFKSIVPLLSGTEKYSQKHFNSPLIKDTAKALVSKISHSGKKLSEVEILEKLPVFLDPQTSGGLLFSLPTEQAMDCVEQLNRSGYPQAAIIGKVCLNNNNGIQVHE